MKSQCSKSNLMALVLTAACAGLCLNGHAGKPVKPPPPPPSPTYHFVPLGTFGGWFANAVAVSARGLVAGSADLDMNTQISHAFLVVPKDTSGDGQADGWFRDDDGDTRNDLMLDLGVATDFAGMSSYATDVNDAGQVTVDCYHDGEPYVHPQACLVIPADMNGDGQPEWFWPDANGANALMTRLEFGPALAVTDSQAQGINCSGQVVGVYNGGRGFLIDALDTDHDGVADTWYQDTDGNGVNDLLVDLGAAVSQAGLLELIQPTQINDAGQIVGMVPKQGGWGDPCILTPRTEAGGAPAWNVDANGDGANDLVIKLPLLQVGMWGCANGVNSEGVVVGWSQTKVGNPHAMMWQVDALGRVTTTDLGIMPGEAQSMAMAVNDSLQVVGFGRTYQMRKMQLSQSAFLWQNGGMQDLRALMDQGDLLAGRNMEAYGLNNGGLIVGFATGDSARYPFLAVPIP